MPDRPRTWNLKSIDYSSRAADYQDRVVQREQELLLPWVNDYPVWGGEIYFATNRDWIGKMALPYLLNLLKSEPKDRHVLEIGGGEGKALLFLINQLEKQVPTLPSTFFTMTSLTTQPEHEELKKHKVNLKIPQIAEELPPDWTQTFDMVLTCALFGWANAKATLPHIKRVLKPNGYWFALEAYQGAPIDTNADYPDLLRDAMSRNKMSNIIPNQEYSYWVDKMGQFPVVYQKSEK